MRRFYTSSVLFLTALCLSVGGGYAYAQTAVSAQASSFEGVAGGTCSPVIMETITHRAWLSGQREVEAAATFILKPGSVLEYSCFKNHARTASQVTPTLFTGGGSFGGLGGLSGLPGNFSDALGSISPENLVDGLGGSLTDMASGNLPGVDLQGMVEDSLQGIEDNLTSEIGQEINQLNNTIRRTPRSVRNRMNNLNTNIPRDLSSFDLGSVGGSLLSGGGAIGSVMNTVTSALSGAFDSFLGFLGIGADVASLVDNTADQYLSQNFPDGALGGLDKVSGDARGMADRFASLSAPKLDLSGLPQLQKDVLKAAKDKGVLPEDATEDDITDSVVEQVSDVVSGIESGSATVSMAGVCGTMAEVWQFVKCQNFPKDMLLPMYYGQGGDDDWYDLDPRSFPVPCDTDARQARWYDALLKAYPLPAEPEFPDNLGPDDAFDLPLYKDCSAIGPVMTGVEVKLGGRISQDAICWPGCNLKSVRSTQRVGPAGKNRQRAVYNAQCVVIEDAPPP